MKLDNDLIKIITEQLESYMPKIIYKAVLESILQNTGPKTAIKHIFLEKLLKDLDRGCVGYTLDGIKTLIENNEYNKNRGEKFTKKEIDESLHELEDAGIIKEYIDCGRRTKGYELHKNIRMNSQALSGFELYFIEKNTNWKRRGTY